MKIVALTIVTVVLAACSAPKHADPTSNGRMIFATGSDVAGSKITAARPPLYPNCAACHRSDGSGGVRLPGGAVSADLRYAALVSHQKKPYTIALLERAISRGIDNQGKPLNAVMPRWRMGAKDLADVALYVTTLK